MAKLVVLSEGFTGRTHELKGERTTIGRLEDNTFQIPEPSVSSHHCEVILRDADALVKDLNSTNGTYINGEKITEGVLKPGQVLRVGQVEMRLEAGPGAPTPSKKPLDHTRPMEGVKFKDLESTGGRPVFEKNSPFAKKSNKANKIFLTVGIIVVLLAVALIIFALQQL